MADKLHPVIKLAGVEFADGKLDRRDFLRVATLLGVSAPIAFGMAGLPSPASAQGTPKKGGTVRRWHMHAVLQNLGNKKGSRCIRSLLNPGCTLITWA